MEEAIPVRETEFDRATHSSRNVRAALLSIIPGMGHVSKGHTQLGLLLMFAGATFTLAFALLLAAGTLGLSLLFIPIYWLFVAAHAFAIRPEIKKINTEMAR